MLGSLKLGHAINLCKAIVNNKSYSTRLCFIVGKSKKYLIDGGNGQKIQFKSLKAALKQNHCIVESTTLNPPGIKNDKIKIHHDLNLIVNTHPHKDHCGGINKLLEDRVCCLIITTSAASLHKQGGMVTENYECKKGDCPYFWFPNADGQKHTFENLPEKSTVRICQSKGKKFDYNATSILTTVKLPESKYDYDVVLTGDSYGGIILKTLGLRLMLNPSSIPLSQERKSQVDLSELNPSQKTTTSKQKPNQVLHPHSSEESKRKTVGIFQVPHHGSKENSTMASTKGEGSIQKSKEFYMVFDADIYLISHGHNETYKHPNSEVITGILAAAVEKKGIVK